MFRIFLWSSHLVFLFDLLCAVDFIYKGCSLVPHALVKDLICNYYKKNMLIVGFHLDSSSQVGIVPEYSSVKLMIAPSKSFVYWYEVVI